MTWLIDNLATIIVSALLVLAMSAVVYKMIKDRKNGKGGCGCGCEGCAMADKCHKK